MAACTTEIDFLPHEKRGMAHVVCDELARLTYESPNSVFISRLVKLRELSEAWAADSQEGELHDGRSFSVTSINVKSAAGNGSFNVVAGGKKVTPIQRKLAASLENGSVKVSGCQTSLRSTSTTTSCSSRQNLRSGNTGVRQPIIVVQRLLNTPASASETPARMEKVAKAEGGRAIASLQCPHCPRKFCFQGNMHKHCEQEHGQLDNVDTPAVATAAGRQRTPRATRRATRHFEGLSCPTCARRFYYIGCLQKHQELQHGMQVTVPENALTAWLQTQPAIAEDVAQMSSFQCTECDRTFPRLTSLCWHIRVHYLRVAKSVTQNAEIALTQALHDGPYQCTVCDRHFATESDLSMHIANNLDSHECADCGRRIESAFYLRVHQMAHRGSGGQPVVKRAHEPRTCPICGRTMKSASNLHGHMAALHAQTKKFICDVCARQFARRSQLTRHMLCHGGERRFECGKCGRRFLLRDMMRRHMRAVHARLRPHLCNLCGRPFAEKHQLNTHMKVHRA